LGPWACMIVLTSVLAVQALLFQDGGLLALGANIFNMAGIGVLSGWLVYGGLKRVLGQQTWATIASGFAAAWLSVVLASLFAAAELALSGTSPWAVVLPAMGLVHVAIGIGEGLITVAALGFLRVTRPDLLSLRPAASRS
jgi:cobalt/nickel transport system permease protein